MACSSFIRDSHGNMLLKICYQIQTLDEVCRKAKCIRVLSPGTQNFVTKNNTYSWNRRHALRDAFMIYTQGSRQTGEVYMSWLRYAQLSHQIQSKENCSSIFCKKGQNQENTHYICIIHTPSIREYIKTFKQIQRLHLSQFKI